MKLEKLADSQKSIKEFVRYIKELDFFLKGLEIYCEIINRVTDWIGILERSDCQ